jgi:hypothetical protein
MTMMTTRAAARVKVAVTAESVTVVAAAMELITKARVKALVRKETNNG